MPKVVRFYRLGGPEALQFEDHPSRQPKAGEVRIRVQAVGLNRADALYTRGQYLEQPRLPSGLGYEAAGIVEAVGLGVDATWIGRAVATVPGFSINDYPVLGEEAVVPIANVAPYPEKLTPVEAAAMWMQYLTAWGGLVHLARHRQRRLRYHLRRIQLRRYRRYPDRETGRRHRHRHHPNLTETRRTP